MERCMSCISKLGALSMSRSSTATGTPGLAPNPPWPSADSSHHHNQQQHQSMCPSFNQQSSNKIQPVLDSMSLGSSNSSEYSVPRLVCNNQTNQLNQTTESWYEQVTNLPNCNFDNNRTSSPCQCCNPPNRPPKPNQKKPPMPLPQSPQQQHVGPYENYDIPRTPMLVESSMDNYDTPKKIKEYLSTDKNSNPDILDNKYGNYDMPATIQTICGCSTNNSDKKLKIMDNEKDGPRLDCTCNRVMSWADNWITLPYCRRGNGIENTGVPINRVKLSGEGKMPVMQPSGELAIYATVDLSKKINRRLNDDSCDCQDDGQTNYTNIEFNHNKQDLIKDDPSNYMNLDFAQSLENYENAREVLLRSGITAGDDDSETYNSKICHKCGHSSKSGKTDENEESENSKDQNYMMMEPGKLETNIPGYIPMAPAGSNVTTAPPIPSKADLMKRILGEKSASIPSLCGPVVDRSRKRCKERIPGTAMMMSCRNAGSPYNRHQLMNSADNIMDKRLCARKRSNSAEASLLIEKQNEFESVEMLRKSSLGQIEGRRSSSPCLHQETELCEDESCCTKISVVSNETDVDSTTSSNNPTSSQISQIINIRRSASVPCKAQNRDSSSSNDSGVSTGSLRQRGGDFSEFELPLSTALSMRRYQKYVLPLSQCVHSSLPRRSKSFDPLRDISFQFQRVKIPEKSTSAEAEVPVCPPKSKGFASPNDGTIIIGPPYIDSRSTSSGTSDMSDYIETLSLSSHSSSDTPEGLK